MNPRDFWKLKQITRNKYGNEKADHSGQSFASKLEAALYDQLKWMEKAGELQLLQTQATVYLGPARIKYIPDFKVLNLSTNEEEYYEAKGFEGPRWGDIKKNWKAHGPGKLHIYKGEYSNIKLHELIIPNVACSCVCICGAKEVNKK